MKAIREKGARPPALPPDPGGLPDPITEATPLPASEPTVPAPPTGAWVDRVVDRVSKHEGRYDSLNLNTDAAGLSFGILQWAQRTGDLGKLLAAMATADSEAFQRIFGPSWQALLDATAKGSLGPVEGALLWRDPWVRRFQAAGQWPVFQAAQRRMARDGQHFQGALQAARVLGVATERALALYYDTAVQQGATAAVQLAEKVAARYGDRLASTPYDQILHAYATAAADRVRRATEPAPHKNPNLRWVQVGNEWHLFAGKVDLYNTIKRRRFGLLADADLRDDPVAV